MYFEKNYREWVKNQLHVLVSCNLSTWTVTADVSRSFNVNKIFLKMNTFQIVINKYESQSRRQKKTTTNKNSMRAIINYSSHMFLLTSILLIKIMFFLLFSLFPCPTVNLFCLKSGSYLPKKIVLPASMEGL